MPALVDVEEEILVQLVEALVAHVVGLDLVDQLLQIAFADQLQELLVLRRAVLHLQQADAGPIAGVGVALGEQLLGFLEIAVHEDVLLPDQVLDQGAAACRSAGSIRRRVPR